MIPHISMIHADNSVPEKKILISEVGKWKMMPKYNMILVEASMPHILCIYKYQVM